MRTLLTRMVRLSLFLFAVLMIGCRASEAASPGAQSAQKSASLEEAEDLDGDGMAEPPAAPSADELYAAPRASPRRSVPIQPMAMGAPPPGQPGADKPVDRPDVAAGAQPESGAGPGAPPPIAAPMLIYTARLHLAVFEAKKALDSAEQLARSSGGYLVRRNDRTITFRVPAGKFEGTLAEALKLGDVLHREVTARDVTEEFFDVQVRLQNLEAVRARFEELLKRAQKVEEALAVERELERVAGQIEQLKGRLKLLKELVAFSTITIELQPRAVDRVDSVVRLPFPWLDRLGLGELLRL